MTPSKIIVDVSRPLFPVSPTLYGLFFEEINHAGDGGIYAEMVRNRSFSDAVIPARCRPKERNVFHSPSAKGFDILMPEGDLPGWHLFVEGPRKAEMSADDLEFLAPGNPRSLRLEVGEGSGSAGIVNEGFWGMSFVAGESYRLTVFAKSPNVKPFSLKGALLDGKGHAIGQTDLQPIEEGEWVRYEAVIQASATDAAGKLQLATADAGTHWFGYVSLFPVNTHKQRPNGLRPDLVNMLKGLHPAFLRFPGGCFVEGFSCETAYDWKATIGPVHLRRGHWNLWQYRVTNGLGFHEYLELCEDIGAAGMYVFNCGITCQMRGEEFMSLEKVESLIQDTLDAIEYATGPVNSVWGAKRAAAGHPEPFPLKYLEIGNENMGPEYEKRYKMFYEALSRKHPELILIANEKMEHARVDVIDDHFYAHDGYFHTLSGKYDKADRRGPKVYVGEYAVVGAGAGRGNLRGAVGEAAFLTGLERNSDVVTMSSYAPLFVNVNDRSWNPDLIQFDNRRVCGIPSYYVQKIFAENAGDQVLDIKVECPVEEGATSGGVGFGTWQAISEYKDLKVVSSGGEVLYENPLTGDFKGLKPSSGKWEFHDGALRQCEYGQNHLCLLEDKNWKDYTVTCRARLIEGNGVMLAFNTKNPENHYRWQYGWNNGQTGIEQFSNGSGALLTQLKRFTLEEGRWYDMKLVVSEESIRTYLDGEFMQEAACLKWPSLSASATLDETKREVILKLVNALNETQDVQIDIGADTQIASTGREIICADPDVLAENTLENPTRIIPAEREATGLASQMTRRLPPCSVTILRVPLKA
ncbi:alpha-L-arabinofuranosidase C-terminal domain-containing protein [Kamptonema cortianum]|uniref:non-reducing end alpha-L-arabinofuranosidase n=1 Tax=Geitlerinema calcuttense NRMC-F 0142 TaxID=2922238 RepID=A0ABT7M0W5_9CYAN|nr:MULTISPECIES: alpha-L-arabinofuranosidase C-terminal domain-containing protein [Cyanophyceae]MDK3161796.1 alpha-L-arabinofuranosidase C-terminal domain-containing protein [Kamptonema cortianum]MDL5054368.1 alpha-L-arabinofuranosidase C-terminal domain-containing protein [Oscillatoria laete-virens NRMC-F 0139]MDL5057909.1 alpha-L-arabinofuranosidase C-terminal domain-containing protein [Geitlerinema calcuttense NRMC-F 0142]